MEKYTSPTLHSSDKVDQKPSPTNFDEYISWACAALQENFVPVITRSTQASYNTSTTKGKKETPLENGVNDIESDVSGKDNSSDYYYSHINDVNIEAIYDTNNLLVKLKFNKNNKVPRNLLKLISLIVPFHPQLTSIYINKGLNQEGLYELSKIIASSYITEVILDGTLIKEGNFYFLLENTSNLKYLSLARCNINDVVVKELTVRLLYPLPMSKILSVLNLSSNRITNNGAKYLGEMLKANTHLAYLNLADNMITDTGAESILNSLVEFPLPLDKIIATKTRKYAYLIEKSNMIKKTIDEMLDIDLKKNFSRFKSDKACTRRQKDSRVRDPLSRFHEQSYTVLAENAVSTQMGPFTDPYSSENTINRDGTVYCLGNNALCYLSLAYNDLTNTSVKKLYSVLNTQYNLKRTPRGLVNVCIDGNDISDSCADLARVNFIIDRGFTAAEVGSVINTSTKKKGGTPK